MRFVIVFSMGLALAACEAAGIGGPVAGPSPTPTPTPTPTPAPTPTPTPAPSFGFAAPFSFETDIGIEALQFTRTDPGSPLLVTDLRDVRLLGANRTASMSYRSNPRSARFVFGSQAYDYGAPATVRNDLLLFGDQTRSFQIGPLPGVTTQLAPVLHTGPAAPNVIVGAGRPVVLALVGNRSADQSVIDAPRLYDGVPGIISEDILARSATVSIRSAGQGVRVRLSLVRKANDTEQPAGEVELLGTHDPVTNRLSGVVTDSSNGNVGTFSGSLYGPAREFAGLVFEFRRPQNGNVHLIGYLTARGQ